MSPGAYRILDANLNRSREGLRVCEDVARFILDSEALSKELKSLRHGIASTMRRMPPRSLHSLGLLGSRDADRDVGKASRCASEMTRRSASDIFTANIQRVKESLRVLEEFAKLYDIHAAMQFRRLRFRTYSVEKKAVSRLERAR